MVVLGIVAFILAVVITCLLCFGIAYKNGGLKCPKCGNYMNCYHYTYSDNTYNTNEYVYTCKNCGYRFTLKV